MLNQLISFKALSTQISFFPETIASSASNPNLLPEIIAEDSKYQESPINIYALSNSPTNSTEFNKALDNLEKIKLKYFTVENASFATGVTNQLEAKSEFDTTIAKQKAREIQRALEEIRERPDLDNNWKEWIAYRLREINQYLGVVDSLDPETQNGIEIAAASQ